jgi:hypothetical protein
VISVRTRHVERLQRLLNPWLVDVQHTNIAFQTIGGQTGVASAGEVKSLPDGVRSVGTAVLPAPGAVRKRIYPEYFAVTPFPVNGGEFDYRLIGQPFVVSRGIGGRIQGFTKSAHSPAAENVEVVPWKGGRERGELFLGEGRRRKPVHVLLCHESAQAVQCEGTSVERCLSSVLEVRGCRHWGCGLFHRLSRGSTLSGLRPRVFAPFGPPPCRTT